MSTAADPVTSIEIFGRTGTWDVDLLSPGGHRFAFNELPYLTVEHALHALAKEGHDLGSILINLKVRG